MLAVFFVTMNHLTTNIFQKNIILFFGSILFLLSSYQIFEMFSLARGFVLSAGALSIATYFLCKFQISHSRKDIVICLYWAILATLSQLVSLFTFIAILKSYIFMLLLTDKNHIFSEIKSHAIQYASFVAFLAFFLFMGTLITGKDAPIYSSNAPI